MKLYLITVSVALMVLGGCVKNGDAIGLGLAKFSAPKPAPKQVRVSNKEVVIAGPKGFCVDPSQTKDTPKSAFVLLGSCRAISNSVLKPKPPVPAILVATVSGKTKSASIGSSVKNLERFFKSSQGRAALSRDGRAQTVTVLETRNEGDVFYLHARDNGTDAQTGAGAEYWRALFNVNGRIVSTSVTGLAEQPISSEASFKTLTDFTDRIIAENTENTENTVFAKKTRPADFLERLFKKDPV